MEVDGSTGSHTGFYSSNTLTSGITGECKEWCLPSSGRWEGATTHCTCASHTAPWGHLDGMGQATYVLHRRLNFIPQIRLLAILKPAQNLCRIIRARTHMTLISYNFQPENSVNV